MRFLYGILNKTCDVTAEIRLETCSADGDAIIIPPTDVERCNIVGIDPAPGVVKSLFYLDYDGGLFELISGMKYKINLSTGRLIRYVHEFIHNLIHSRPKSEWITLIHQHIAVSFGRFNDELPEQELAVEFIKSDAKVLEIGGNIGRNSLVISSILENDRNLLVLESDPEIASKLLHNRNQNHFRFNVQNAALSNDPLIQNEWITKPLVDNTIEPGWKRVPTITWTELKRRFPIDFDTLVLDCEGAFFKIVQDFPEILIGIKTIIVENDYPDEEQKRFVDDILVKNGFSVVHKQSLVWGGVHRESFYEVWQR